MNIFRRKLAFQPVDPLGAGLREEIESQRRGPGAISLYEDIHAEPLASLWQQIAQDTRSDPNWTHFADADH